MAGPPASTQVLVAGGGPVGLATAIELGRREIECVVIEPRTSVSHARPRCKTINVRTMEHLRRWGIAERLRERAPLPVAWSQDIVFCTSLAGWELSRFHGVLGLVPEGDRFPELGQQAPQYALEELLRDVVTELPSCRLVTGRRVTAVDQDDREVRVSVVDGDGRGHAVACDYLVGCDGPRSTVREAIGAAYVGEQALRSNFAMVFRAPGLFDDVRHGRAVQYWVVNPRAPALVGPLDREGTWWIIALGVEAERGIAESHAIIDAAAGTTVDCEVLSHDPWTAKMQIVDHLRRGRVFLAGDAAHLNPPFGGHGLNTGIGDAVDLGWKLAAVLHGWGGLGLLDSYEAERRPVQTRVIDEAAMNMRTLATDLLDDEIEAVGGAGERAREVADARIQEAKRAEFFALDLVLDIAYESPVIAGRPTEPSAGRARPGARLPHVWLGDRRSLFDVLGDGLTLLVVDRTAGDPEAMTLAAGRRGVPLSVVDISDHRLRGRFGWRYILVRPDQHVAWCQDVLPADPLALLDQVCGASGVQHDPDD